MIMYKKVFSFFLVGVFLLILMKSSWHYCRPDSTKKSILLTHSQHLQVMKKYKPPCAVLKEVYSQTSNAPSSLLKNSPAQRGSFTEIVLGNDAHCSSLQLSGLSPPQNLAFISHPSLFLTILQIWFSNPWFVFKTSWPGFSFFVKSIWIFWKVLFYAVRRVFISTALLGNGDGSHGGDLGNPLYREIA